jgi:hypothetical protein
MDDRARALNDIAVLARRHGLSAAEITLALESERPAAERRRHALLVRVLALLGGIFVFAGVGVFIGLQWEYMNSAARVIVTLGSGLAAFVLAVLSSRDSRVEKAATPLFLIAAALEPTGMMVAFQEFGSGGDWRYAGLATAGTTALQFGAAFGVLRRSALLFVAVFFATAFWWTALDLLDVDQKTIAVIVGASLVVSALGADRAGRREITPAWYLFGGAAFLAGLFGLVEGTPIEILFLAVSAAFVYVSAVVHSRALLLAATVAILAYTGWFTTQHFADSVGWPLALVAFGFVMIGLSGLAFRIDRDYIRVDRASLG